MTSTTLDNKISGVSSDVWPGAFAVTSGLLGVLHLVLANEYLGEDRLVGSGFVLGGVALVLAAAALLIPLGRRILGRGGSVLVVVLAALVDLGFVVGGILSRTVGLPGGFFEQGNWETSLVVSIVLGLAALVLAPLAVQRSAR